MFSKEFLTTLSNLTSVTDNVVITGEGKNTYVTDINKSIIAQINREAVNLGDFESFGVKSLSKFLSLISTLTKDGKVNYNLDDGILNMKTDSMEFDYYVHNARLLKPFVLNEEFIGKIEAADNMFEFTLDVVTMKKIVDIASLFELEHVIVTPNSEDTLKIEVTRINKNTSAANLNKHKLDIIIPGTISDPDEYIVFDVMKLKRIPTNTNYNIQVKYVKGKPIKTMIAKPENNPASKLFIASTLIKI